MKAIKTYALLVVIFTASLLISSCKKSDSSGGSTSKVKLLTSGKWTLSTMEYQKKDGTWVTQTPTVYSLVFNEDKTLTATVGTTVSVRAWSTTDDFSTINIVGTSGSGTVFTVSELSSSRFQITLTLSSSTYTKERDTFTH